jgi:hypothetical protein
MQLASAGITVSGAQALITGGVVSTPAAKALVRSRRVHATHALAARRIVARKLGFRPSLAQVPI